MNTIEKLTEILIDRKGRDPGDSYVASLYAAGLDQILKKVGEEAAETLLAAKDVAAGGDTHSLLNEVADLWFHTMVMLVYLDERPADVLEVLEQRFGTSGHAEKRSRGPLSNAPE